MNVCIVCETTKDLRKVELIEDIPGDPRGDGTFLWEISGEDVCKVDRKLLKEKDWNELAERRSKAMRLRKELEDES